MVNTINFLSGILFTIPVLVSVFLTVLTLVSQCSRACRYNMCVIDDNCLYKRKSQEGTEGNNYYLFLFFHCHLMCHDDFFEYSIL